MDWRYDVNTKSILKQYTMFEKATCQRTAPVFLLITKYLTVFYLQSMSLDAFLRLIKAIIYLEVDLLTETCCKYLASLIKNDYEELKKYLKKRNDEAKKKEQSSVDACMDDDVCVSEQKIKTSTI